MKREIRLYVLMFGDWNMIARTGHTSWYRGKVWDMLNKFRALGYTREQISFSVHEVN